MKYLYFFVILLFPLLSSAQISLGVTVGANIGKFGGVEPPDASYTSRTGINFGGIIAYRFNEDISLTIQPMYSQRGCNIEVGEDTRRDSLEVYEMKKKITKTLACPAVIFFSNNAFCVFDDN